PDRLLPHTWTSIIWIIPTGIAALCWAMRNRAAWLNVAAGIFFAALLPVLGLLPFDFQYYSTVADRYMYVALLGPAIVVGYILSRWPKPWLLAISGAVVIVLSVLTYRQTGVWRDTSTLFNHTLAVNPNSLVAHQ